MGLLNFIALSQQRGFVNCRLYSSQSSFQSERSPDVFPYDSDLESSCSGDITSKYEGCSDDEEDEIAFHNQENDLDKEEKESDIVDGIDNEKDEDSETEMPAKNDNEIHLHIKLGIPDDLSNPLNQPSVHYSLPQYKTNEVEAVLSNLISFKGSNLISPADLKSLTNSDAVEAQDKWLTNFIIDDYMRLIQSTSHNTNVKVKAITWEVFEKTKSCKIAKHLQDDKVTFFHT